MWNKKVEMDDECHRNDPIDRSDEKRICPKLDKLSV